MSVGNIETRARPMPSRVVARRRRVAAMFGILLFLGVTAAALLLIGLRNSPQPMVPILRANREIMPGTRIKADDLAVTYVFVQDPSLLPTLARDTDRARLIGQTAVALVYAAAPGVAHVSNGINVAVSCAKLHDRLLRPFLAADLPPELASPRLGLAALGPGPGRVAANLHPSVRPSSACPEWM